MISSRGGFRKSELGGHTVKGGSGGIPCNTTHAMNMFLTLMMIMNMFKKLGLGGPGPAWPTLGSATDFKFQLQLYCHLFIIIITGGSAHTCTCTSIITS